MGKKATLSRMMESTSWSPDWTSTTCPCLESALARERKACTTSSWEAELRCFSCSRKWGDSGKRASMSRFQCCRDAFYRIVVTTLSDRLGRHSGCSSTNKNYFGYNILCSAGYIQRVGTVHVGQSNDQLGSVGHCYKGQLVHLCFVRKKWHYGEEILKSLY